MMIQVDNVFLVGMLNLHDLGECDTPADIKWMLVAFVVELPNDSLWNLSPRNHLGPML
jgi:hypothetical protein